MDPKHNSGHNNDTVIRLSNVNWKGIVRGFSRGARKGFVEGFREGIGLSVKETNKTNAQPALGPAE